MRLVVLLACMLFTIHSSAQGLDETFVVGTWTNPTFINSTSSTGCPNVSVQTNLSIISGYSPNQIIVSETWQQCAQNSSTNPPTWQSSDGSIVISYSIDPVTNQSTLLVQYSSNSTGSSGSDTCIASYSYQRNNTFMSGTWYLDFQNDWKNESLPVSVTIANVDNLYMTITYTYSNSTTQTQYLYEVSPNNFGEHFGGWIYSPNTDTFTSNFQGNPVYSRNGSYLNPTPFITTWTNPEWLTLNNPSKCCVPDSIEFVKGPGYPEQLSAQLYFNQSVLDAPFCGVLRLSLKDDYVPLNVSVSPSFSSVDLFYLDDTFYDCEETSYGFTLNYFTTPTNVLIIQYDCDACSFTMTPNSSNPNPNPLSSERMPNKILSLLIVMLFIVVLI